MTYGETIFEDGSDWDQLTTSLNLCNPFDGNDLNNVYNLFGSMIGAFYGTAQYNSPSKPNNLKDMCEVMTNKDYGDPLTRIGIVMRRAFDIPANKCLPINYADDVKFFQDESYEAHGNHVGYRQWVYQTCTEFGWYQSGNMPDHPYGNLNPIEFHVQFCKDVYGEDFTLEFVEDNVKHTNAHYGGINPGQVTNTINVHGSFDPWHPMGILEDINPTSKAVVINGTSHCYNMRSSKPNDPEELTKARDLILKSIKEWIEYQ